MGVAELLLKKKTELAAKNLAEGIAFMEENSAKEGVVTTDSGLQYEIMVEGEGVKPALEDTVLCHYHGTNLAGEVFDSSVQRKKPAAFPLNKVIKGWTEAVQLMPVGSKWKLIVPAHLAYGKEQISKELGPNSTLVFEVELLGIL